MHRCSFCRRECINKVCEAAGLKTVDKKRRIDKQVQRAIADVPRMEYAGANVNLNISSSRLTLTSLDSYEVIASHDMPRISFASGGDCVSYLISFVDGASVICEIFGIFIYSCVVFILGLFVIQKRF